MQIRNSPVVQQANAGPDGKDTLAGIYLLAQQWLADVLSPKFPELDSPALSLDDWFASPQVSWKLQVSILYNRPMASSFECTSRDFECMLMSFKAGIRLSG